uniref:Uncharacterized protein n=1 Tax=Trypanosoma congolense (strain IL3000) TaxID=1068625 RepID=G0USR7_TRYCI|nr:hypothetical protein, unlikely [Trypanosoma congolense IL3000]
MYISRTRVKTLYMHVYNNNKELAWCPVVHDGFHRHNTSLLTLNHPSWGVQEEKEGDSSCATLRLSQQQEVLPGTPPPSKHRRARARLAFFSPFTTSTVAAQQHNLQLATG